MGIKQNAFNILFLHRKIESSLIVYIIFNLVSRNSVLITTIIFTCGRNSVLNMKKNLRCNTHWKNKMYFICFERVNIKEDRFGLVVPAAAFLFSTEKFRVQRVGSGHGKPLVYTHDRCAKMRYHQEFKLNTASLSPLTFATRIAPSLWTVKTGLFRCLWTDDKPT